jgi:hypothetical protein
MAQMRPNPRSIRAQSAPIRTRSIPNRPQSAHVPARAPRQPRRELQSLDDFTDNSHG